MWSKERKKEGEMYEEGGGVKWEIVGVVGLLK